MSEPLSSLINCSNSGAEGNIWNEDGCNIVNRRQKMARQLNFEAPSILCKRRRNSLQQRDSVKTRIDEASIDLDKVSDFVEIKMPASPPEMPLFKTDDPFTPSRVSQICFWLTVLVHLYWYFGLVEKNLEAKLIGCFDYAYEYNYYKKLVDHALYIRRDNDRLKKAETKNKFSFIIGYKV